jgi:hypothetical protein
MGVTVRQADPPIDPPDRAGAPHAASALSTTPGSPVSALSALRDLLAERFDRQETARRIVRDARLRIGKVGFHPESINTWGSILDVAIRTGRIHPLLDTLSAEADGDAELTAAIDAARALSLPPRPGPLGELAAWMLAHAPAAVTLLASVASAGALCFLGWIAWKASLAPPEKHEGGAPHAPFEFEVRLHRADATCPLNQGAKLYLDVGPSGKHEPLSTSPADCRASFSLPGDLEGAWGSFMFEGAAVPPTAPQQLRRGVLEIQMSPLPSSSTAAPDGGTNQPPVKAPNRVPSRSAPTGSAASSAAAPRKKKCRGDWAGEEFDCPSGGDQ